MNKVNHYVAWMNYKGDKVARYQGLAATQDEFEQMCLDKGYDLSQADEIECVKTNVTNELGGPCAKNVSEY